MHPDDVWVIYNNQQGKILEVHAIEEMADTRLEWYWLSPDAPCTGSVKNIDKIECLTLSDAIIKIRDNELIYNR